MLHVLAGVTPVPTLKKPASEAGGTNCSKADPYNLIIIFLERNSRDLMIILDTDVVQIGVLMTLDGCFDFLHHCPWNFFGNDGGYRVDYWLCILLRCIAGMMMNLMMMITMLKMMMMLMMTMMMMMMMMMLMMMVRMRMRTRTRTRAVVVMVVAMMVMMVMMVMM